jgi:hypothetical protein
MWTTAVVGAGILGFLLGWDGSTFKDDARYQLSRQGWLKIGMLAFFGAVIALQVQTIRGFLVVYLSSLGAYYLVKQVGEQAQIAWYRWRDPHPTIELRSSQLRPNERNLWISSKCTSPVHVETIFLKDRDGRILPISSGLIGDREFEGGRDGWLRLKDAVIRSNGGASAALISQHWDAASNIRAIGRYSNGGYWVVEEPL